MKALLQRVSSASVVVEDARIASIGPGLLVFLGVERGDAGVQAEQLLDRVLRYRIFPDAAGRMNLCLEESRDALLLVPQFTLAADTRKGRRPSFSSAASPELGLALFNQFQALARQRLGDRLQSGRFGADMKVHLINDGPVTFWLDVPPPGVSR